MQCLCNCTRNSIQRYAICFGRTSRNQFKGHYRVWNRRGLVVTPPATAARPLGFATQSARHRGGRVITSPAAKYSPSAAACNPFSLYLENNTTLFGSNRAATMSTQSGAPYIPQDPAEVNALFAELEAGKGKKGTYKCRKSSFEVKGTDIKVHSWKFGDWDYKKRGLPTYARGLFSFRNKDTGNNEICIRGYDKFFNIGEVDKTRWDFIRENTKAPYELTLKENGCIIFISGLPDGTLLVCSKHSTGVRQDVELSHAMAGEKWVDKQLKAIGKTRRDLAEELRAKNITAVAELCDDSFEEHILEYAGNSAGLYLHGINLNLNKFTTYDGEAVQKFADEWGFLKVETFYKQDVDELKAFLEEVAETGAWSGRDVEGFVIRCKARDSPKATQYHDWFFKYKFEEPYLLYRLWREVTKQLISGKKPKFNKHVKITEEYLQYAARKLREDKKLGKEFMLNHGIIAMREGFLKERGIDSRDIIKADEAENGETKTLVLVPIATIGCGKTTVAVALTELFDWGHVQNDNITTKKGKPAAFVAEIAMEAVNRRVIIADRNNHQFRERKQLIEDVTGRFPDAKFVALHYVHYRNGESLIEKVRQKTEERVFARGDNHQTIQAGTNDKKFVQEIMRGFQGRFEPIDTSQGPDDGFDLVIDLDPLSDSRQNLETVIKALKEKYDDLFEEMPSAQDMDEAINSALKDYNPDIKHIIGKRIQNKDALPAIKPNSGNASESQKQQQQQQQQQPKPKKIEYFAIKLQTSDINTALENAFKSQSPEIQKFYNLLKGSRRIQPNFHVTMIHNSSSKAMPDLWKYYKDRLEKTKENSNDQPENPPLESFQVRLEKVIWDSRMMTIKASLVDDKGCKCANSHTHVTVGTANESIKPKESNDLLKRFSEMEESGNTEPGLHSLPLKNGESVVVEGDLYAVYPQKRP